MRSELNEYADAIDDDAERSYVIHTTTEDTARSTTTQGQFHGLT